MTFFSKAHERILRKFLLYDDFVLIGGHAVVFHGVRRTTADIDILVRPTFENGEKILKVFKSLKLKRKILMLPILPVTRSLLSGWNLMPSTFLTFSKAVSLEAVFTNAISANIDDLAIRIIDIRDLLMKKEHIKRSSEKGLVDQQDILALTRILQSRKLH